MLLTFLIPAANTSCLINVIIETFLYFEISDLFKKEYGTEDVMNNDFEAIQATIGFVQAGERDLY